MSSASLGLVFPGQGAHDLAMLDAVAGLPEFAARSALVADVIGSDPIAALRRGDEAYLNRNVVSSLLTVLVSSLLLDDFRRADPRTPVAMAGYSIGQWTALHAAGSIDFAGLVRVVGQRARRMDDCLADHATGMLAVIGLSLDAVEDVCRQVRDAGAHLSISNVNCVGQYSLAGTAAGLERGRTMLDALRPRRLVDLPVSGAWHCDLLHDAAVAFRADLEQMAIEPPRVPVIDNATGTPLPAERASLLDRLADQVRRPVRWADGVTRLIALGCTELVEIGYGDVLTKFGFFIDRSVIHRTYELACVE